MHFNNAVCLQRITSRFVFLILEEITAFIVDSRPSSHPGHVIIFSAQPIKNERGLRVQWVEQLNVILLHVGSIPWPRATPVIHPFDISTPLAGSVTAKIYLSVPIHVQLAFPLVAFDDRYMRFAHGHRVLSTDKLDCHKFILGVKDLRIGRVRSSDVPFGTRMFNMYYVLIEYGIRSGRPRFTGCFRNIAKLPL